MQPHLRFIFLHCWSIFKLLLVLSSCNFKTTQYIFTTPVSHLLYDQGSSLFCFNRFPRKMFLKGRFELNRFSPRCIFFIEVWGLLNVFGINFFENLGVAVHKGGHTSLRVGIWWLILVFEATGNGEWASGVFGVVCVFWKREWLWKKADSTRLLIIFGAIKECLRNSHFCDLTKLSL